MKRTTKLFFLGILLGINLLFFPLGLAEEPSSLPTPTETQLTQFAKATKKINEVAVEFQAEMAKATTDDERLESMKKADEKAMAIIEKEGLTIEEYNEISGASYKDEKLRQKIEKLID